MDTYRGRSNEPINREAPAYIATAPNHVRTWDITWLNSQMKLFQVLLDIRHVQQVHRRL